jgi:hypothetical protein
MGRRRLQILSIALGLMLVLIAGSYVLLTRHGYNALKPGISSAVRELTGRELTIQGDIEPGIGMNPTIVVKKVVLRNASWGSRPDMVRIERSEAPEDCRITQWHPPLEKRCESFLKRGERFWSFCNCPTVHSGSFLSLEYRRGITSLLLTSLRRDKRVKGGVQHEPQGSL